MKHILVVDNYDSFVYNLVHYLDHLGARITVKRNDEIAVEDVAKYDKIVLSPGPGLPSNAGILNEIIKNYAPIKSILGVCLGLQAIGEVFGARLQNLETVFHGIATPITLQVNDALLFHGLPSTFNVGRYHSWVIAHPVPHSLEVTSLDIHGNIMSIRHRQFDVCGVQFHPESILTPFGKKMISNWLSA